MLAPALLPRIVFDQTRQVTEGVYVSSFRAQRYHWIQGVVEEDNPQIHEMLVDLVDATGAPINNGTFFDDVHARDVGTQVDLVLVPQAIRFAQQSGLFAQGGMIAVNMYATSATHEFFDACAAEMEKIGYPHSLMIELLEYHSQIDEAMLEALRYGHEACGISFSIDDVDPRIPHDLDRIKHFADLAQVVKLRSSVIEDYLAGRYDELADDICQMTQLGLYVLAEGVKRHEAHMLSHLGLHATQSMFGDLPHAKP